MLLNHKFILKYKLRRCLFRCELCNVVNVVSGGNVHNKYVQTYMSIYQCYVTEFLEYYAYILFSLKKKNITFALVQKYTENMSEPCICQENIPIAYNFDSDFSSCEEFCNSVASCYDFYDNI